MATTSEKRSKVRQIDRLRDRGKTQADACRKVGISPTTYRSWKMQLDSPHRTAGPSEPMIFISHRHDDAVIADALRRQLLNWDFTDEQVFQSSHPKSGPTIGSSIKKEILRALAKAHLVILVFTYERYDWQYCMWEVGLAMEPLRQRTRVIALQCFDDVPKVFHDQLIVAVNYSELYRLVRQLHKVDRFFPTLPAYRPKLAGSALRDRTKNLLDGLQRALADAEIPTPPETTPRWGFITVHIAAKVVKELDAEKQRDPVKIRQKLESAARVVAGDKSGLSHFGFDDPKRELKRRPSLQQLVRNWSSTVQAPAASDKWATDLCDDIHKAVQNWKATPSWQPFRSAGENAYVFPLVNTVRRLLDESMEFDVYVYRVPAPKAPPGKQGDG